MPLGDFTRSDESAATLREQSNDSRNSITDPI